MKFDILNRWSGAVQFTADIECAEDAPTRIKIGLAVKWAVKSGADLRDADLRDADMIGADMRGADMSGADLRGADMRGANMSGADMSDADMRGADMRGADMRGADMSDADMRDANMSGADMRDADMIGADMRGANMSGANMRDANMSGADMRDANMSGADLDSVKADFYLILLSAIPEIPALRSALIDGRINGSNYRGECACLVGTIANARHVGYNDIPSIKPDFNRPAERWFLGIRKGDTPETNQISQITVEWIDEFVAAIRPITEMA